MIGRNDDCFCGSGKKWKKCHFPHVSATPKSLFEEYQRKYQIMLKTDAEIAKIRQAGHLAAEILDQTCRMAKAGVTTNELNAYAHELHLKAGAIPACLKYGYPPFPKSICTSLNEVICHGIPDDRPLQDGDILNIDVTAILDGYYGDCSKMVHIGSISPEKKLVSDVAYECLMRSIATLKPGVPIYQIGNEIESYATAKGCSVVYQFVAHGVGKKFHEAPQISHAVNRMAIPLAPGMTFTIEPMINLGQPEAVIDKKDRWTARTIDLLPSAQWEHTLLITEDGYEILTPWTR
ncbi:MAG: map1 [Chlamydiales bacterium]|jgi:methionyl aminopeptidase|nr:map1 [Chlamydiales bacterium]